VNRKTGVLTQHDRLTDAWITLESGPVIVTPANRGRHFRVILTENAQLEPPHNPHFGQCIVWRIQQDSAGSRTLTLNASGFTERQGSLGIDSDANAVSFIEAYYDEVTETWDVTGVHSISSTLDGLGSTVGSILYRDNTGWTALTPGTEGQVLTAHGPGSAPTWS